MPVGSPLRTSVSAPYWDLHWEENELHRGCGLVEGAVVLHMHTCFLILSAGYVQVYRSRKEERLSD